VIVGDAVNNREAKPSAITDRSEPWLEDDIALVFRDSRAVIGDIETGIPAVETTDGHANVSVVACVSVLMTLRSTAVSAYETPVTTQCAVKRSILRCLNGSVAI
jgi:hypothetical protein